MIRLVILGSSASVPSVERALSCVALRHEGDVYLFDCGEGAQRQMMRYKVSYAKVKAIFITHLHADHVLGIPGLVHTLRMIGRKEPLLVFGPRGTCEYIRGVALDHELVDARDVEENFCFKGDEFSVRAFPVEHGLDAYGYVFEEEEKRNFDKKKAEGLGIKGRMFGELQEKGEIKIGRKRILLGEVTIPKKGRKIVYTGDTMPCKNVELASKGADVLIHDATFGDEMKEEARLKLHSTSVDAASIAKKAGAKKLILTHISNRYKEARALEEQARKVFKNSEVARDGMEILV